LIAWWSKAELNSCWCPAIPASANSAVNELHKVLVPPRGIFAAGKFDQYKRDILYATLLKHSKPSSSHPWPGRYRAELPAPSAAEGVIRTANSWSISSRTSLQSLANSRRLDLLRKMRKTVSRWSSDSSLPFLPGRSTRWHCFSTISNGSMRRHSIC
jgi:hypothetical protein